jgi:hypothetical protein
LVGRVRHCVCLIAVVCFSGQQLAPLSFAEILGSIRGTY